MGDLDIEVTVSEEADDPRRTYTARAVASSLHHK